MTEKDYVIMISNRYSMRLNCENLFNEYKQKFVFNHDKIVCHVHKQSITKTEVLSWENIKDYATKGIPCYQDFFVREEWGQRNDISNPKEIQLGSLRFVHTIS